MNFSILPIVTIPIFLQLSDKHGLVLALVHKYIEMYARHTLMRTPHTKDETRNAFWVDAVYTLPTLYAYAYRTNEHADA